jgi:hypothetical protein
MGGSDGLPSGLLNIDGVRINPSTEDTLLLILSSLLSSSPFTYTTPSDPSSASVGIAASIVVPTRTSRRGLTITNTSANIIYLAFGKTAILGSGIILYPHGTFNMDDSDRTREYVSAIASSAGSSITIQEYI